MLDTYLVYNARIRTDVSYKSNRNVVYSCKYHIVWCPKYRRRVLVNGVDIRLKEITHQAAAELKAEVIELEIMPDHVRASVSRGRPSVWDS